MTELVKGKKYYNPQNYGLSYTDFKDLKINTHQGMTKGRYYCVKCSMIWHKASLLRGRGSWRCPRCHSPLLVKNPYPETFARKVA